MCETTAALLEASAGVDESWVLNRPPVNGCQHDACELELICDTGHVPAAAATVGVIIAPAPTSADATPTAVQTAVARLRKLRQAALRMAIGPDQSNRGPSREKQGLRQPS